MSQRFSSAELGELRNDISIRTVIDAVLQLPSKEVEGVYRFLCPVCEEFETGVHPRENLGRCFRCKRNFNPLDLVMAVRKLDFVGGVKFLREQMKSQVIVEQRAGLSSRSTRSAESVGEILARVAGESSNREVSLR